MKIILHLPTGLFIQKYVGKSPQAFYDFYDLDDLGSQNPYRFAAKVIAKFHSEEDAMRECAGLVTCASAGFSATLPQNLSINEFIVIDENEIASGKGK